MADTNRFNFHKHLKPFRLALAGILALMLVVVTGIHSYAAMPEAAIIAGKYGSDLFVGTGTEGERIAAQLNNQLRGNSILYVPGGNRGWAHLGFVFDWPLVSADLLVQAGPHNIASQWSFPCTASGGFKIAWNRGSQRGCEEGARITRSGARSQGQTDPNGESILGAKGILKAQGGGEEVIVAPPSSDSSIIQTYESANGIEVETIQGNILVKSAKYPQGRLIPEGQRYSYPQDSTMPIDRNAIANSREMQDFLNPNNWSSPDLPPRVADGIGEQLGEMRTALGQNTKDFVLEGQGIDWCLSFEPIGPITRGCGEPAASYFCQQQGYSQAISYQTRLVSTTRLMGTGHICSVGGLVSGSVNSERCDEFTHVVCSK